MNNKLVFVIPFAAMFIIMATSYGWILSVNAQDNSSINVSSSEAKTTTVGNSSSIITPWNTGNDGNNRGVSSQSSIG